MKSFKQFFLENIEEQIDESETKYIVKGKSPFYKQDHYINTHETPKAQLIKKHIKNATRMDLETAKKVAKDWESHPNKYKTEVVPVKEEVEQLDELSPKTLKSYSDKANKSLDRLAKQRDAVEKSMSKTYAAVGKRNAAEKAAHSATSQAQHNKATAEYRVADKSAKKNLAGHNDLAKQHSQLTKKINKRMDGMDRAYDKMHEDVELDEDTMPGNVALRLVDRHHTAAFHHKKNGNMKGYAAHFKVANAIEDSVIRAGRDMPIRSKRLEAASDKVFKEHPHRVIKNEDVEITEATAPKFKKGDKVHYETSRDSKDNKGVVHSHDGDQVTIIGKDWLGGPQKITVHQGFVRKQ